MHAIDGKDYQLADVIYFTIKNCSSGLWKLSYPHCMWYLPSKNVDFGLDIPPVRTNQLRQGYAFCDCHAEVSEKLGAPFRLRAFLKHCGVDGINLQLRASRVKYNSGDEVYTKDKSKQVEGVLKRMHNEAKKKRHLKDADLDSTNTPVYEQGNYELTFKPQFGFYCSKAPR